MNKKQSLVVFVFLCACYLGFGQPWAYDFGTSTGTYNIVNGVSTTFLPQPTSGGGEDRIRIGTGAGSWNMENQTIAFGNLSYLRGVAATGISVNKFSIYDYDPGKTFTLKFDMLLGNSTGSNTATSGEWDFFVGDGADFSGNGTFTGNQTFLGIQLVFGSGGTITTKYRNAGAWTSAPGTPFLQGNSYSVEIYGNNTTGVLNYNNGSSQSVASNTFDLWVNDILIGDDLSKAQIANDVNIDSIMFNGINSTSNVANIFLDNFEYSNSLPISTDEVDFCSVDFPENGTIVDGGNFIIYGQAYEPGVTEAAGQGTGLNAWIGYSTTDATTITDFTSPNWTWVAATFNSQQGNNDQFEANIGPSLSSGTYYYVSRFQLNGGPYTYGGKTPSMMNGGNFWDDPNYVSGVLLVTPDQVDFCNVDYPKTAAITMGSTLNVYAQAYEPGVTDSAGQGGGIQAWIGYNTIGEDYEPWNPSGWTWVEATYDSDWGNNDQYVAELGCGLPAGTYYYASRFQLNGSDYSYGGIRADNMGNFWDYAPNDNNGTLVVTNLPLADVVITEIMYNTSGTDDEWIEICNVSGSTQDISNYSIDISSSGTVFTFPCNTTIADGTCITVSLGSNGDGTYNNGNGTPATGYCPFTPDFGVDANTNNNGILPNGAGPYIIKLNDSNGASADTVSYSNTDGADGNGSSLHVIDATQDNSDTGTNWQEVAYGGSWGINSLTPKCLPIVAEIRVDGNLGVYPNIPDDDTSNNTPIGTNNTLFAAQFVGSTQSKSYRIQNLGGLDLILTSVSIIGVDPGEFNVSINPASPIIYGTPSILEITFAPNTPGIKNAIVEIVNNDDNIDGDTEEVYTFNIRGEGLCVGVIDNITPTSGPEGTILTVSASGIDLNTATASFNGVPATTVNYISATDVLEVTVPNGASDGNLELLDGSGCNGIIAFDVIDTKISSCGGSGNLSDLIISEITDATTGGVTYIEIYNGTGSDVSLNGYSIEIFSNGGTSSNSVVLNNLMLVNDDTYVVAIGVSSSPVTTDPGANTCPILGGNGELADQTSTVGGINKVDNQHDMIRLVNAGSTVDEFGVYQDNDWMDSTIITGNRGFNFRRLNTASPLPNPTFNINDWNVIDWVGSGLTSCSTNDYSDIRVFDFSTGTPPSVATGPTINSSCNSATISVTGTEGSDPAGLAYQWYTSATGNTGWTALTNGVTYNNVTTGTLNILDTSLLEGYQYYCQIREDDSNCYSASDAVKLTLPTTTWTIGGWSNGVPDIYTIAIIDYPYDTFTDGSFSACSLTVNDDGLSGFTLNIADGNYVEVQNNLTVNGNIVVQPKGTFVQINDDGVVDGSVLSDKTKILVAKKTTKANNWYEYTYWSSPVKNETIGDGLFESTTNRRFKFNAQNYLDHCAETNNNNMCDDNGGTGLQDGIDDNGDDWQWVNGSTVMQPGVGYASTHNSTIFGSTFGCPGPTCSIEYSFEGPFNNGEIKVPVYRNDFDMNDTNSNFIGNPYPSAISADTFFDLNAYDSSLNPNGALDGVIYLWSQNTQPSATANGNQNLNFSDLDYAIINAGTGSTAGGDELIPDRFIPSGQGFFVSASDLATVIDAPSNPDPNVKTADVIFNNSMRIADGTSNSQFFRTSGSSSTKSKKLPNKLWVNLTSDNGVFSQILVGYVNGATNSFDGMYYDVPRNLSPRTASTLYSLMFDNPSKYAIQGKEPNSLNLGEIIPLGFYTAITGATLYKFSIAQIEGDFLTSNTIYLKDNLLNKVHDLTASDYTFTSEVGEFKDRFEIVFQSESLSDVEAQLNINKLTIIELNDGHVQMKTNSIHTIKSVQILDLLGRTLYQLKGTSTTEIYNLNNLSQSAYIAKVELSNGQIITKKAIKRN